MLAVSGRRTLSMRADAADNVTMAATRLPEFRKPPVAEVVLGAQFDPLPGFTNGHLGAFWKSLPGEWPTTDDAPALPQEFERFGDEQQMVQLGLIRFSLSQTPASRLRIWNRRKDRMIQIQNGRLHYNWLGEEDQEYVRYPTIKAEMFSALEELRAFVRREELGELRFNQWEVTYVNHLPRGTVWNSPADWSRVFASSVCLPTQLPTATLEGLSADWRYALEGDRGRLHIQLQHAWRDTKKEPGRQELLIFKLTARGPMPEAEGADLGLGSGLDVGRNVIVTTFKEVASIEARQYWEELT